MAGLANKGWELVSRVVLSRAVLGESKFPNFSIQNGLKELAKDCIQPLSEKMQQVGQQIATQQVTNSKKTVKKPGHDFHHTLLYSAPSKLPLGVPNALVYMAKNINNVMLYKEPIKALQPFKTKAGKTLLELANEAKQAQTVSKKAKNGGPGAKVAMGVVGGYGLGTGLNCSPKDDLQLMDKVKRSNSPTLRPHTPNQGTEEVFRLDVAAGERCLRPAQRMEYLGHTQTATYMSGPKMAGSGSPSFLPSITTTMQSSFKPHDNYPAPSPMRRSLTTLPWRPSTYYSTARVDPAHPVSASMPDPSSARNKLTDLDPIKVPPVFAAARNALYTRYTPNDWMSSNQSNYMASDRVRSGSERVRLDTSRLVREVDDKTQRTQGDVGKKLGERLGDIHFWKTEVNNEIDNMITEIDNLQRSKQVLEKALAETENPLHIAQECLYNREKRQSIDLVHDNVEKELIKEVDTIKRCQEEMRRLIQDANNQVASDRAAQHELELDSQDKFIAMNLDGVCHQLHNTSRGIAYHSAAQRVQNTVSVPESWARFSNDNIQRSQSERAASKDMRNKIECLLNKCATAMVNQWNSVNNAHTDRIKEYMEAKHRLQTHLSKVLQEIFDMEKNIELLKKCIQDKEAPMQVAQTRLATRTRRPNVESCRDPVQHRLVEEVHEINETVDHLKMKLREAENALQHLLRTKSTLEQDLSIKNNSLFIDRERCMGMRKTFPMSPRVASY